MVCDRPRERTCLLEGVLRNQNARQECGRLHVRRRETHGLAKHRLSPTVPSSVPGLSRTAYVSLPELDPIGDGLRMLTNARLPERDRRVGLP